MPLIDTLADALRPRRLLLALDNCEHLVDACAQPVPAAAGQRARAAGAGTSREPLRVAAEAVWQVPPLALPPPGAAARPRPGRLRRGRGCSPSGPRPRRRVSPWRRATAPAAVAICRAAGRAAAGHRAGRGAGSGCCRWTRSPARLGDRFRLLTTGDRTAPPRHRTLRATIDWSHDLLSEPSRCCCGGCRCSPAGRWRWPSRSAPTTKPAGRGRCSTCWPGLADKSLVERRARRPRPGPVPDAGDHPRVRRRPAGARRARTTSVRTPAARLHARSRRALP